MGITFLVRGLVLAAAAAAAESPLEITVQLYNNVSAPRREVLDAQAEAGRIFQKAGIQVNWRYCLPQEIPGNREPGCEPIDVPTVLVISIISGLAPNGSEFALGFALMQGHSNHAAVLYPKVSALVADNPQYRDCSILGNAIAHELGHLLLRSTRHEEGLMRARWDKSDLRAMAQRRLVFNKGQAQRLREMLLARTRRVKPS